MWKKPQLSPIRDFTVPLSLSEVHVSLNHVQGQRIRRTLFWKVRLEVLVDGRWVKLCSSYDKPKVELYHVSLLNRRAGLL